MAIPDEALPVAGPDVVSPPTPGSKSQVNSIFDAEGGPCILPTIKMKTYQMSLWWLRCDVRFQRWSYASHGAQLFLKEQRRVYYTADVLQVIKMHEWECSSDWGKTWNVRHQLLLGRLYKYRKDSVLMTSQSYACKNKTLFLHMCRILQYTNLLFYCNTASYK